MEAANSLLYSSPSSIFTPRSLLKHFPSSSSSAFMLHDQTIHALNSLPDTSSTPQHFPTSVLIQEQRDDNKPLLKIIKEDKTSQATPNIRQMEIRYMPGEDNYTADSDIYLKEFQSQLLRCPDLGLPSLQIGKAQSSAEE